MKSVVFWGLFVVAVSASPALDSLRTRESSSCPPSSGLAGACVFIQGINCISDSECSDGKVCCSEGCGSVCKVPIPNAKREIIQPAKRVTGSCPASSGLVGICLFVPGVNCIEDSECAYGKLCCSEGCGKMCKEPVAHAKREVTHAGSCPKVDQNMLGFCVFRPGINCLSDDECTTNQRCCQEGCGRVCKTAV
ncbi:WAP four-disulfide core domain protein 5-like [Haliotis rufescens]|uniref:WAP four-disulfide core domain protein 5-like n=1 Tax=Haliotis rufescens TaxID=6454 RepID=UPI00201F9FE7|nr:WAP four-disulfide core domain protein 5-like [Haliotis rufescens]